MRHSNVVSRLIECLTVVKMDDSAKLNAVISDWVDPKLIWKEVDFHRKFFSVDTVFDGGFTLAPLIRDTWTVDDFCTGWHPKLADSLRQLRNGVVHAREGRMARSIAPTASNSRLLWPWAHVAMAVADQIMLSFGDVDHA